MEQTNFTADAQYNKMINTPIPRLISKLAIPTVISMLVTAIYSMADTFFVSQINKFASAGVGIVFPIMSIIQACGFTLGMGAGSLISVRLGQKRNAEASTILSVAFFSSIFLGSLILVFGNAFAESFLSMVGASPATLPYAQDYAEYIFYGAPFMTASFVMNNALRSEGKAFFSMVALTLGGVLNIILDPVFIFYLDMGISGAAIATLVSQVIGFLILLSVFILKKSICKISIKSISRKLGVFGRIVWTGFPSLSRQGLASVSTILLNTTASFYGDEAVAAMSIATKILMFVASVMIGIGQGFSPVAGYNYGAKRYDRVKKAYWFMLFSGFSIMVGTTVLCIIFAKTILAFFINDPKVIEVGASALRWQISFLPFRPLIVGTNMLMQSTHKIKSATFLSMNRQGIFFIPAILILPYFFGLKGVETSQFVADVLSAIVAIPFAVNFFRKLEQK